MSQEFLIMYRTVFRYFVQMSCPVNVSLLKGDLKLKILVE